MTIFHVVEEKLQTREYDTMDEYFADNYHKKIIS